MAVSHTSGRHTQLRTSKIAAQIACTPLRCSRARISISATGHSKQSDQGFRLPAPAGSCHGPPPLESSCASVLLCFNAAQTAEGWVETYVCGAGRAVRRRRRSRTPPSGGLPCGAPAASRPEPARTPCFPLPPPAPPAAAAAAAHWAAAAAAGTRAAAVAAPQSLLRRRRRKRRPLVLRLVHGSLQLQILGRALRPLQGRRPIRSPRSPSAGTSTPAPAPCTKAFLLMLAGTQRYTWVQADTVPRGFCNDH